MAKPTYKIGLVLDTSLDPSDGVQQYVIAVGMWLQQAGHDVHYLVGETSRTDLPNIHSLSRNMNVCFNGNRTTIPLPTSKRKLRAFVRQEQFDILHVQTPHHPLMAQRLICATDPRTAVIATFHILPYNQLVRVANKLLGLLLRPSLKRIDTMLAVSPAAAEFEQQTFGVAAQVLPNVFDYQRFASAKPMATYNDKTITILFLGRLVPRKGCQTLLEAVAQLDRATLPKFRVVICGKGPLLAQLQAYVAKHDLADSVEFVGFVSEADKPAYYASADIAVFPSSSGESFGIVLIEAMASGRAAVLAGNNPGYASVMAPQPSLLFNPTDPAALAALLTTYLTDAEARQTMASWASMYARDFDVERVGQQLVKVYETALARRRSD